MNTRKRWQCQDRIVLALATTALLFGCITSAVAQNGNAFGRDKNGAHPLGGPPGLSGGGPPGHANQGNSKGPRGKDTLIVVAQTSSGGSVPSSPGNAWHNSRYVFCLDADSSFDQTFPLEFTLTNTNGNPDETVLVTIDPVGRLAGQATVPIPFMLTDDGSLLMKDVSVATGPLEDGAYTLNLRIRATPARRVHRSHHIVRIHVLVGSACNGEEVESEGLQPLNGEEDPPQAPQAQGTGFFTDGEFNLLQDCDQEEVVGHSGGTFTIVTRPETNLVTATNPGTFYLNLIWPNTGPVQTVTIDLSATNRVPKGANAVHALLFDSNGFMDSKDNWDMVNDEDEPCDPEGPCELEVDSGQTLWLTWHLVFAGTGSSAEGISSICEEGEPVTATATLTDGGGELPATTVEATGHVSE